MKTIRRTSWLALAAALLLTIATVSLAAAYFSDYETALGEATLYMSGETKIHEGDSTSEKVITIENTGKAPVVVRVAVYGPDAMKVDVPGDWTERDGFYYYNKVLGPGETTASAITASIALTDEELAEFEKEYGSTFDITVIHESALVIYDDSNNVTRPEGWSYIPRISAE